MKQRILNKYAFTLVELIFVAMIIGLIMPAIFGLYNFIIRSNREINARQDTIQQGYEFFERLNILMQDYTIDYEEYFNRQMVGCTARGDTGRNIGESGYCTEFTAYGNGNSTNRENGITTGYHDIYYCSISGCTSPNRCNRIGLPVVVTENDCGKKEGMQSYGQYEAFFTDVGKDTEDKDYNMVGDGDDYNRGFALNNINAIFDDNHIQELYLISHDGKNRLFFRRKLYNQNGKYSQYKIEMLRLRGFDAGIKHNFEVSSGNVGLYDGKIDTWVCDAGMGFEPKEAGRTDLGGAYSGYYIPETVDDCWIPLTYGSTSVSARNIAISPTTDSDLSWNDASRQINAYMKILTINGVYLPYYTTGSMSTSVGDFSVPLETTINMKDFYRE